MGTGGFEPPTPRARSERSRVHKRNLCDTVNPLYGLSRRAQDDSCTAAGWRVAWRLLLHVSIRSRQYRARRRIEWGIEPMKAKMKSLAARIALIAVRLGLPLPGGLVGKLVSDLDLVSARYDGWDAPLMNADFARLASLPVAVQAKRPRSPRFSEADAKLRCLVAVGDFDLAGSSQVAAFLARRLPEQDVATCVAFTPGSYRPRNDRRSRLAEMLRAEGATVTEVGDATDVARLLDQEHFDVIHTHGAPEWWIEQAVPRGIPVVNTLHGLFYDDWCTDPKWGSHAAAVIAVSDAVREGYLTRGCQIAEDRVVTIENCVDDLRLQRVERSQARAWLGLDDEYVFVCLARHGMQKNQIGLIRAFEQLPARYGDVHLIAAGGISQPVYARMEEIVAQRSSARSRIHLRDHIEPPSVLLAAADGFVLDSFFEGGPLASVEALFAGVPVVLSDVGAARSQVGDGWAGHVVANPTGDPLARHVDPYIYGSQPNTSELVAAMSELVENRQRWSELRSELAARAAEEFGAERCLSRHVDVLSAAVGS
jgi:glycosyltransferase involved in cell wall biosynthesis